MKEAIEVEAALRLALEALQDYVDEYGPWREDSGAQYALRVGKEALMSVPDGAQPEPYKVISKHLSQSTDGRVCIDPVTGDFGIGSVAHPLVPAAQREPTKKEHDVLMGALKRLSKVVDNGQTKDPEQEPVAYLVTGPYEKQAFSDIGSANAYCRGLNKGFDTDAYIVSPLYTTPPQRKPLPHSVMVKHMKESCDSMEMRGAFADGWMSAEAAHGIKE